MTIAGSLRTGGEAEVGEVHVFLFVFVNVNSAYWLNVSRFQCQEQIKQGLQS